MIEEIYKKLKEIASRKETISRRNLTTKSKYILIAELSKLYEHGRGGDGSNQYTSAKGKDSIPLAKDNVLDKTAKVFGTSRQTVATARKYAKIVEENPETKEELEKEEKEVNNEI